MLPSLASELGLSFFLSHVAMTSKTLPILIILLALGSATPQRCTPLATHIADGQIEIFTSICSTIVGTGTAQAVV